MKCFLCALDRLIDWMERRFPLPQSTLDVLAETVPSADVDAEAWEPIGEYPDLPPTAARPPAG